MKQQLGEWPLPVRELVNEREQLRQQKDFDQADSVRKQLEVEGYEVRDGENGVEVWVEMETGGSRVGAQIGLFGSGETAAAGGQAHETLVKSLGKDNVKIALVATPAGFQPNVEVVYGEIANYLKVRLQNYHPKVTLIKAYDREKANNEVIIEPVLTADYIFTGPGSPTFAVKQLRETKLLRAIYDRVEAGAVLGLASSAVIAFSNYCLPVYEIYKVGEPLSWIEGLNGYEVWLKKQLTIIPHFNNTEGGNKTDTSRCFMGGERFGKLLKQLPANEVVWGIDEQTAVIIDLKTSGQTVYGKGRVTLVQE